MWTAPFTTRIIPGKSWGGRLITHTELPTEGRRLFKLDDEDLTLLLGNMDVDREEL